MGDIQAFIKEGRAKKLSDAELKELLLGAGWSRAQVNAALLGLDVPSPDAAMVAKDESKKNSLSGLEAAMHHILLWVFTFASSIVISVVAATLFGYRASTGALSSYIAVVLVTFTPYVAFYIHYLKRLRSDDTLTTGRVWSIITIVVHSVGLISALITLLVTLINVHERTTTSIVVASSSVALLCALVVVAYIFAYVVRPTVPARKMTLLVYPVLVFVLLAAFGAAALVRLGPLRADDTTRQHLVGAAKAVRTYTQTYNQLPASLGEAGADISGVEYKKLTDSTYQLCATFIASSNFDYTAGPTFDDGYVSRPMFEGVPGGHQCFSLSSTALEGPKGEGRPYPASETSPSRPETQ